MNVKVSIPGSGEWTVSADLDSMINDFSVKGKHGFLSNMACAQTGWPALRFRMSELEFPSAEHTYMAAKDTRVEVRKQIAQAPSPFTAKKLGKAPSRGGIVTLRSDWEEKKLLIMLTIVRQKFAHPAYGKMLLATGNALLVEGNKHGDTFWGSVNGKGENWLGKILMLVRQELREKQ